SVGAGANPPDTGRAGCPRTLAAPHRAPRRDVTADTSTHRVIRRAAHPSGALGDEHFDVVEEPVPEPADGEALVRTLYLSLDPAIRVWMNGVDTYVPGIHVGDVMRAGGLGEVVRSRNPAYTEGDLVFRVMRLADFYLSRSRP